ncbi:MAG: ABC transporter permease [Hyphomicrobiales bacterium]|nr:ABC transporter permease [Hyphomicrobiales bacterium]
MRVTAVLPEAVFGRDALFVSLPLLIAAEDFREGLAVPELNVTEGQPERPRERTFASARLYAQGLDDVAPLAQRLRDEGLDVVTRAKDIETVKAIDRVLTFVFLVLAGIGVIGYLLSLAASTWANIDRKRREIALLRLLGLRTGPLIAFPMTQAVLVGLGGIVLSAGLYLIVSKAFNTAFAAELGREEFVCRLLWRDGAIAAGLTLVFAITASLVGGYRASKIDPAKNSVSRSRVRPVSLTALLMTVLTLIAAPASNAAGWPEKLFNPQPLKDDVILRSAAAMAFSSRARSSRRWPVERPQRSGSADGRRTGYLDGARPDFVASSFFHERDGTVLLALPARCITKSAACRYLSRKIVSKPTG